METSARYLWVGSFIMLAIGTTFGFIYWLNNQGGLGKKAYYQIRFNSPVSGLQKGAAVQFNGIRVGEVTGLKLDVADPTEVTAAIAISDDTPLRADSKVTIDFQGLMGTPAIALSGGSPSSPVLKASSTEMPVLNADPDAGQDLTKAAKKALGKVDKILGDNADDLRDTIGNLKVFSDALSRNSNRIDGILAGLEHFTGGDKSDAPKKIYDLTLVPQTATVKPVKLAFQFVIAEPTATLTMQTQRFLTKTPEGELGFATEGRWADTLPKLVQSKVLQAYEDRGFLASALLPSDRTNPAFQLIIDIRSFAINTLPEPTADVELSVKIIADDGRIVSAKVFHKTAVCKSATQEEDIANAVSNAFNQVLNDMIQWTTDTIAS